MAKPCRFVDLSHRIREGMPVYPGDPLFRCQTVADHDDDGYRVSLFSLGSHLGTHLDFPLHAFSDGEHGLLIPLDVFCGPAVVINLVPLMTGATPFVVDVDLLLPFFSVFENAARVLLRTDWGRKFGTSDYYYGFPSLTTECALWLTRFPLCLLGVESPSMSSLAPDNMPAESLVSIDVETLHADRECHRLLLGRTPPVVLLEGLTNLDRLPAFTMDDAPEERTRTLRIAPFSRAVPWDDAKLFSLTAIPLPIDQADGCPVRAVATIDGQQDDCKVLSPE